MDDKYTKRPRNLFDASGYASIDWIEYRKNKPMQDPIDCHLPGEAMELKMSIPGEWAEHIDKMAKKLKIQPEFLYRKAIQAFFGFAPAIWNDDEYLDQWREVYKLEGETALRPHIQSEDDRLTAKIIRARNKNIK
jgi:hypothetical protein